MSKLEYFINKMRVNDASHNTLSNDPIENSLQKRKSLGVARLLLFCFLSVAIVCIVFFVPSMWAFDSYKRIQNNSFQCKVTNVSIDIIQSNHIYYQIDWSVLYFKKTESGNTVLSMKTIDENQKTQLLSQYKIGETYSCVRNNNYFNWSNPVDLKQMYNSFVLLVTLGIIFSVFIPLILIVVFFLRRRTEELQPLLTG